MHPFSLLIKPVSDSCNLQCSYCFYKNTTPYQYLESNRMDEIVLERLIKSYLATRQPCYTFTWQGGEPTLLGHDFFLKVVELQKKHSRKGSFIANGVQTNGTLLDDKLCRLFAQYNFLIGCSLDGPAYIHDQYRRTPKGEPTHASVIHGIKKMQQAGVDFNIMTLVSQANVHKPKEVYRYLRDNGFFHHQYIPCVEFDEKRQLQPFAINGEEWGNFLNQIFDEWYANDIKTVSVRHFDTVLSRMVDNEIHSCTIGPACNHYFVVEHNGDIYPCDFYVNKKYLLGNSTKTSWEDIARSEVYSDFSSRKSNWSDACQACDYLQLCGGDCPRHRCFSKELQCKQSMLCSGWKKFYTHTHEPFTKIAEMIHQQRTSPSNLA